MKVIFCDVDGVLNNASTSARSPGGYVGVSEELIRNLKEIVDETSARIILSSDWRLVRDDPIRGKDYRYLVRKLLFVGHLKISGHTDDIGWSRRGREIRKYLDDHPEITGFVVLDDIPFSDFGKYNLLEHFVNTDNDEGLTQKDAEKAILILNGR